MDRDLIILTDLFTFLDNLKKSEHLTASEKLTVALKKFRELQELLQELEEVEEEEEGFKKIF